jgi:hypothetical protein
MIMISILILPLLMFRSYGDLTPIGIASLAFISIIVLFVLIEGQVSEGEFLVADVGPSSFMDGVEVIGTFAFGASVQYAMFEGYLSTKDEDKPMFIKVILSLSGLILFRSLQSF